MLDNGVVVTGTPEAHADALSPMTVAPPHSRGVTITHSPPLTRSVAKGSASPVHSPWQRGLLASSTGSPLKHVAPHTSSPLSSGLKKPRQLSAVPAGAGLPRVVRKSLTEDMAVEGDEQASGVEDAVHGGTGVPLYPPSNEPLSSAVAPDENDCVDC